MLLAALSAQAATPKTPQKAITPKAATPKAAVKTTPKTGVTAKKAGTPVTQKSATTAPGLASDDEKTIYALGLSIHRSLAQFQLNPAEVEIVKRALSDAAAQKPAVELNEWGPKIQNLMQSRRDAAAQKEKASAAAYLAKAAQEPGVVKTDSGLVYKSLTPGTGASPKATDTVKVHYRGTLTNGTEFDSSYKRGEPASFPLNGVVPCWTEGVQKMKVGEKAMLVCPSNLAYGDQGQGPIPGGATLIFEIELLEILSK
jgi:FKBP-type peptidyl-prolyl cis-trans isomerase FkpA